MRFYFKVDDNHTNISILKGVVERLTLFLGLINQIFPTLIFFGAIKLGTRLDEKLKVSNDYFLIGNLISVLSVIISYSIFQYLFTT